MLRRSNTCKRPRNCGRKWRKRDSISASRWPSSNASRKPRVNSRKPCASIPPTRPRGNIWNRRKPARIYREMAWEGERHRELSPPKLARTLALPPAGLPVFLAILRPAPLSCAAMERLPGFRDFYPEPLPHVDVWSADARQYIFGKWREVAQRYG